MIVTRGKSSTFELRTCGHSMISKHMSFLLVGVFMDF
jgi:hypothetical protein